MTNYISNENKQPFVNNLLSIYILFSFISKNLQEEKKDKIKRTIWIRSYIHKKDEKKKEKFEFSTYFQEL